MKAKALIYLTLVIMVLAMLASPVLAAPTASGSARSAVQDPGLNDGAAAAADVPSDWWAAVQEDIRQSEYEITWQEQTALAGLAPAYQAPNRAQNLRSYFTPQGIRVIPRVFAGEIPPWEWGLTLTGYGYEYAVQPVQSAVLSASGQRIDLARGPVTEWYVNNELGLKQGFTLHSPPAGSLGAGAKVVLELALSGNLTANLTSDGDAIEFTTPGGVRALRYDELLVTDATGRELPVRFSLSPRVISLVVDAAEAVYPITIDPLATSPNWTAESDQVNARFGWSVGTAGDVNGDGYADVIVGAHLYDNGQTDEGRAFVYYGSAAGLSALAVWTAESNQVSAQFGYSVGTAGDVNGDGYADVILGANYYDNGQSNEGRAHVYHGGAAGLSATANWTAESNQVDAQFGNSVGTAGDVNGDGYADVIVGVPYYDNGETNEGRAYVYHGGAAGLSATTAWTAESNQAVAVFGYTVGTAGDVNADGYADVIVGAYLYDNGQANEGRAFVYHGGVAGLGVTAAWTAESDQAGAEFGTSVGTAGDVNGDGYADVIVGARVYDNGEFNEGRAYVYHGGGVGLNATAAWMAESNQNNAYLGVSVGTAGDVNGDGYADVIVGAAAYDNGLIDEGRAYVYQGGAAGLGATASWTSESNQAVAVFGFSVGAAGDVNDDGYADVIAGAYYYDNGQSNEGRVYVYYGGTAGLSATVVWTAESDQDGALFGGSVGAAGDVNGDGYGDVIVGAGSYDNGQTNEGRAFVYHGGAAGLSTTVAWTAESDQADAYFGGSVGRAGDVNGDGYADVIVGASAYDNGQSNEGRVYVYHGGTAGLSANAAWTVESNVTDAHFGNSVGTAGDVNSDGYADVIVGAYLYSNGQSFEGRAYVYHGTAGGLSAIAAWTTESNQAIAYFGWSVGTAGDVNGDGYADVIVGALYYDNGQTDEGRAYVYHGGAAGLGATTAWTVESDQLGAEFGTSVGTAGDVNDDGYADVVVGTPYFDNGQSDEGRVYVYLGGAAGLSAIAAWTAESNQGYGKSVATVGTAGDVNGDGYADVVVGARDHDNGQTDEGRAYVYQGSAAGLSATVAWTAEGDQTGAWFGNSVGTAGDVNGDGYADVVVGAPYFDNGQPDEGRVYVYHGGATGLSATPAWTGESDQADAYFGGSVGTAGDVNGDGYADVIVGTDVYDNGQSDEGRAFVYHGGAAGLSAVPAWTAESDQDSAFFGYSVGTAGDVNGDGYADVIVAAPRYDGSQIDEGRAFVYHGGITGLSATANWMAEGGQASAWFAGPVGTAGDVNGDGYADVVVGAYQYDNGLSNEGRAYVYHGGAGGLSATPAWTAESDQAEAYFGYSVGTAGDVNGDGYADVVVGAPYISNGQPFEGRAFVYYGNGGVGVAVRPQQRRADDSASVAPGGQALSPTQVRLAALLRTPFGRSDVALQWEIKPEGTAFTGTGLSQSGWSDSGTAGASLCQLVSGLSFETRYHWRIRILGRPRNATPNSAVTYRSRWLNGSTFLTALSGQHAIGGIGPANLLGQTASINVTNQGSPAFASLVLRGYPNTTPPNANSFPGYGAGTSILDRYFSLEPNSDAAGYELTLCLNYDDSEVSAAGASEADLILCRWTGSAWQCRARAAGSSTAENLVCMDNVGVFSNWAIASGSTLAITLSSFDAAQQGDAVLVTWEMVSELDNAGFNLYRTGSVGDRPEPSDLLTYVASQAPGSTLGAAYSYEDLAVQPGQTYWYWLEDIDFSGATTLHGPVSATVQTPTAVTLAQLDASSGLASPAGWLLALLAVSAAGWLARRVMKP